MALRTLARHEIHGIYHRDRPFKHVENSGRGVRLAKAAGDEGVDIDLQITSDGVIVACHDNQPMLYGFHDPLGRLPRDMKISEHTWATVSRLVAFTGGRVYRIRRIEAIFRACHRFGRVAVVEPKANHLFGLDWPWQYMVEEAEAAGTALSARALAELNGVVHIAAAHRAGVQAWLI
jgi:glycerophosphoryl diester phosphodiesterase